MLYFNKNDEKFDEKVELVGFINFFTNLIKHLRMNTCLYWKEGGSTKDSIRNMKRLIVLSLIIFSMIYLSKTSTRHILLI